MLSKKFDKRIRPLILLDKAIDKMVKIAGNKSEEEENTEIERKFLMERFPDDDVLFAIEAALVHQAYLSVEPEIRIRSQISEDGTTVCKQTIKGNGQLKRKEMNIDITEQQYDFMLGIIDKQPIKKEYRKYVLDDGLILEVSKVDDTWYYAEIEFQSEKQANKWKPTRSLESYIIDEVTYKDEFKMKNYWKKTRLGVGINKE